MFSIKLLALVGTLPTGVGTRRGEVGAIIGLAHHKARVHRRQVGDIPAEANTLSHLLVAHPDALVSAPLACLSGLETVIDAVGHRTFNVVDLGQRHCIS